ncbi:hypothetical protein SAMN04487881_0561 [Marinobacter sp. es.048]|nr:hypothetical protein SAMN04487881_0561 [Marinobacter sp. es.048]
MEHHVIKLRVGQLGDQYLVMVGLVTHLNPQEARIRTRISRSLLRITSNRPRYIAIRLFFLS